MKEKHTNKLNLNMNLKYKIQNEEDFQYNPDDDDCLFNYDDLLLLIPEFTYLFDF